VSRSGNFGYLVEHEPLLATLGAAAEVYLLSDPNTAMFKARQFGEELTHYLVRLLRLTGIGDRQVDRIAALARHGVVVPQVRAWLDEVRLTGNHAVHEYYAEARAALRSVEYCFNLGDWLHRALTPEDTTRRVFLPPEPDTQRAADTPAERRELAELRAELADHKRRLEQSRQRFDGHETQLERERAAAAAARVELARAAADREALQARLDELSATIEALRAGGPARMDLVNATGRDALVANAQRAAQPLLSEAQVRVEIDAMLRRAGWQVQDVSELNLTAGPGVAVREVTTAAGRADYVLYVDRSLVGVIEAKREGADLSEAQRQAARYAAGLTASQRLSAWRATLPFQYDADGNQVRFRNALDPDARTRVVFAVHRPETIARWMREADTDRSAPTLRARMRSLPGTFLDDRPLRPAQTRAIAGLERSLARDEPRALIQMATGAGKTYTVVAESHRLLKHADARRILFLVDRNNLGKQAATEFANYQVPDDGRKFTDLYAVQRLSGPSILDSSSVVISTIQRLWKTLTGQVVPDVDDDDPAQDSYDLVDEPVDVCYNAAIPPEAFDVIVVDECHRSIYGRWRAVLEYFDAHVVGLTATPVAQTFGFFHQNLVSEYTYEQAVADGVNVDFDVYRIRTEIGEQGGTIPAETVVPIRDRRTRRERYQELEDDLVYTAVEEGKKVISKGRLRLVLETFRDNLFTEIFPPVGGRARGTVPKTLIFAKDDNHAEEIVGMVREVFGKGDEFCAKITHAARRPRIV
jgi:type I restriction enzyme R subunit